MCTKVKILILSCFQKMYSSEILDIDRNLDNHVKRQLGVNTTKSGEAKEKSRSICEAKGVEFDETKRACLYETKISIYKSSFVCI